MKLKTVFFCTVALVLGHSARGGTPTLAKLRASKRCEKASGSFSDKISSGLQRILIQNAKSSNEHVTAYVVIDAWAPIKNRGLKPASVYMLDKMTKLNIRSEGVSVNEVPTHGFLIFSITASTENIQTLSSLPQVVWIAKFADQRTANRLYVQRSLNADDAQKRFDLEERLSQAYVAKEEREQKITRLAQLEEEIQAQTEVEDEEDAEVSELQSRGADLVGQGTFWQNLRYQEAVHVQNAREFDGSNLDDLIRERDELKQELGLE